MASPFWGHAVRSLLIHACFSQRFGSWSLPRTAVVLSLLMHMFYDQSYRKVVLRLCLTLPWPSRIAYNGLNCSKIAPVISNLVLMLVHGISSRRGYQGSSFGLRSPYIPLGWDMHKIRSLFVHNFFWMFLSPKEREWNESFHMGFIWSFTIVALQFLVQLIKKNSDFRALLFTRDG